MIFILQHQAFNLCALVIPSHAVKDHYGLVSSHSCCDHHVRSYGSVFSFLFSILLSEMPNIFVLSPL